MRRRILLSLTLGLLVPLLLSVAFLAWLTLTHSGLTWGLAQVATRMDGHLSYTSVQGTLLGPVTFRQLRYQDHDLRIVAGDVSLAWRPASLLKKRLTITSLKTGTLTIDLPAAAPAQTATTAPDIHLPIDLSLNAMTLNDIDINRGQQHHRLHRLKLRGTTRGQLITIRGLDVDSDIVTLKLSGTVHMQPDLPHELSIDWRYQASPTTTVSGRGRLAGDLNATRIRQRLKEPLSLQINADLHDLTGTPRGDITISHERRRLRARGQWSTADDSVDLALDWQHLAWPLDGEARFTSDSGSGWLTGNLDDYRLGMAARLQARNTDATVFTHGHGNSKGLRLEELQLETAAGSAVASTGIEWSTPLTWDADVSLAAVDPGHWWPDWPGRIGGRLTAQGRFGDQGTSVQLDVTDLNGKLRGYPLTLAGRADWQDDTLALTAIRLTSGNSHVGLSGQISNSVTLDWRVNSPDLAELLPAAGGRLALEGRATGPRESPHIRAHIEGQDLEWSDYRIAAVSGTLGLDLARPWQAQVDATATALQWADHSIQSLAINGDGQQLSLSAKAQRAAIDVTLAGIEKDNGWQGRLVRADIASHIFGDWQLESAADIRLDDNAGVTVSPICLLGRSGKLCLHASRDNTDWQASVRGSDLPLSLIQVWLPPGVEADGPVTLTADLQTTAGGIFARAHAGLKTGHVAFPVFGDDHRQVDFETGRLDITVDEQGARAQAELISNADDRFEADVELPGARLPRLDATRQDVRGRARLTTTNLGPIDLLLTDVQALEGRLTGDITLSGTLANPRFDGRVSLDDGAMEVPRLGLKIQPIRIQGQTDVVNDLAFQIDATSGNGNLQVSGKTDLDIKNNWPTTLHISGDSFEVSHIPEARVQVTPDLDVSLNDHDVTVSGRVLVPFAQLEPKDIQTAAQVSEDTVIVNAEQPPEPKWRLSANVKVSLGDRVTFSGFDFDGRLTGAVTVMTEPGQLATASGELSVAEGRYLAYRRRLDIERGRLIYTGGPLINPGLDLRAVRHIDNVTAGLKVHGSLSHPQLELFSEPTMEQNDILAYILLGHPLESSTGEEGALLANAALAMSLSGGNRLARSLGRQFGLEDIRIESNDAGDQYSVVVGRHLSPRLYISYGVGQVDALNTLNLRYRISDKWQLTAENGEHEGADLLYTIER